MRDLFGWTMRWWSAAPAPMAGPFVIPAREAYCTGSTAGEIDVAGTRVGEFYTTGQTTGEVGATR